MKKILLTSFLGYHGSVRGNGGMRGDIERGGVVTYDIIYLSLPLVVWFEIMKLLNVPLQSFIHNP